MDISAFGVEHIGKGAIAAALQPTLGGSASAPKGKKLRTGARTTAGGLGGAIIGGVAGHTAGGATGTKIGVWAGQAAGGATAYKTSRWGREESAINAKRKAVKKEDVAKSAFGVDHVYGAPDLGSPATAHMEAHDHGWHDDKPHRECDKCMNPITRKRAAMRTEAILRRAR